MTNKEAIKHITTWLYSAPDVPPKQVVQALELAVDALRAGGTDTNVPTMPAGRPLTMEFMDYKKLADDLLVYCKMNCSACEYAGENEFECTIARASSYAITDLLARTEAAEERCKELEERCKRLNEARERANEAAHKWETMYRGKKEELEMSKDEVSTMSTAGMEMLNAFSEYVRNGSKNPAAYCYYGAAGCGGDGDGCKGVARCNFLPKSGMKGG